MRTLQTLFAVLLTAAAATTEAGGLLINESFDEGIDGWGRFKSAGFDPAVDVDGDPASGSAFVSTADSNFSSMSRRPDLLGDTPLALEFAYRVFAGSEGFADPVRIRLQYLGPECIANINNVVLNEEFLLQAETADWLRSGPFDVALFPPPTAVCVTIQFGMGNPTFVTGYHFDDVTLRPLDDVIAEEIVFADGFD